MKLANRDIARDQYEACIAESKEGFFQTNRDIPRALSIGPKGLIMNNSLAVPSVNTLRGKGPLQPGQFPGSEETLLYFSVTSSTTQPILE